MIGGESWPLLVAPVGPASTRETTRALQALGAGTAPAEPDAATWQQLLAPGGGPTWPLTRAGSLRRRLQHCGDHAIRGSVRCLTPESDAQRAEVRDHSDAGGARFPEHARRSRWPVPRSPDGWSARRSPRPDGLRRVDVIGPGGYGKTTLLDALAQALRHAGVQVRRDLPGPGEELGPDTALLVDDAHLLLAGRAAPADRAGRRSATATWWWRTGRGRARPGSPRWARRWPRTARRSCSTCWTAPGWLARAALRWASAGDPACEPAGEPGARWSSW